MSLNKKTLFYHNNPTSGKISINSNKLLINKFYLSLGYTPGVGLVSNLIYDDFYNIYKYTTKSNLVAVITNGSAVLGLGNLGCMSSKPVMEGKSILFKKFSDINSIDLEIFELNCEKFINIVFSLQCTFGGINLEDIKAPDCFYIEKKLKNLISIPIFHDDQHGTAIVACSAILISSKFFKKKFSTIKLVILGAGAAALSIAKLILNFGINKNNMYIFDSKGLISNNRKDLLEDKLIFINENKIDKFENINFNFDLFIGCSKPGLLKSNIIKLMNYNPIIMPLSNPVPEILPEIAHFVRKDSIILTGRSDYINQVNNLLCFPFIFRGILDSCIIYISELLKIKCVISIANLILIKFLEKKFFFKNHFDNHENIYSIIPDIYDERLIVRIPFIINKYSLKSGLSNKYIKNFHFYLKKLSIINFR